MEMKHSLISHICAIPNVKYWKLFTIRCYLE